MMRSVFNVYVRFIFFFCFLSTNTPFDDDVTNKNYLIHLKTKKEKTNVAKKKTKKQTETKIIEFKKWFHWYLASADKLYKCVSV